MKEKSVLSHSWFQEKMFKFAPPLMLGTGSTVCSFYCVEAYIVAVPYVSKVFIMKRTLNLV